VAVVIRHELCEVSQQKRSRSAFFRIDHGPPELHEGADTDIEPAALSSALVDAGKRRLWCPPLTFAPVKDDPHVAPVLKLAT